ncbi:protein of unknown function [Magnetospirillum sp. XM-1]|nr:protein of unknown function [Magnetospirillum sp. XM-1]
MKHISWRYNIISIKYNHKSITNR